MERKKLDHWLFTIRSLPLMFEIVVKLGCIHQSMLLFQLQRAAVQVDPEISETTLAKLCDAIIQSCLKISVNPQTASITFTMKDDMHSESDFMHALLSHTGCISVVPSENQRFRNTILPEMKGGVNKTSLQDVRKVPQNARLQSMQDAFINEVKQVEANKTMSLPKLKLQSPDMTQAMAFLRRQGIDLIFPQANHDRVLTCILMMIKKLKYTAHRGRVSNIPLTIWQITC
jgi:uncharacterized protein YihD (DUF1040 family)